MEMMHKRAASISAPGVSMKLYIANGIVWVSPGMLETKLIVAPNSPKLRAKESIVPVIMPGIVKGSVIVTNTFKGDAPNVEAACSSLGSTLSKLRRTERTIKGSATTIQAITAPFQLKLNTKPKCS